VARIAPIPHRRKRDRGRTVPGNGQKQPAPIGAAFGAAAREHECSEWQDRNSNRDSTTKPYCPEFEHGTHAPTTGKPLPSPTRRGEREVKALLPPSLAGTVDFRYGNRSLPLKKHVLSLVEGGGQEGFVDEPFGKIPLNPPFSKGEAAAISPAVHLSTVPAGKGVRGLGSQCERRQSRTARRSELACRGGTRDTRLITP
jgi:hypothetical protein